ncbi:hypothetical protein ACPCTG_31740 [Streptomyces pseudogriseolus]|uniref:hypothetical protein n=1 Tax=Streptomyces pseudogriseolus TaxID=36817 RepID=UPI003FA29429
MTTQTTITLTRTAPVLTHYPTTGGATVHLADLGEGTTWRYITQCTGCPHQDGYRDPATADRYAKNHAKHCHNPAADSVTPAAA